MQLRVFFRIRKQQWHIENSQIKWSEIQSKLEYKMHMCLLRQFNIQLNKQIRQLPRWASRFRGRTAASRTTKTWHKLCWCAKTRRTTCKRRLQRGGGNFNRAVARAGQRARRWCTDVCRELLHKAVTKLVWTPPGLDWRCGGSHFIKEPANSPGCRDGARGLTGHRDSLKTVGSFSLILLSSVSLLVLFTPCMVYTKLWRWSPPMFRPSPLPSYKITFFHFNMVQMNHGMMIIHWRWASRMRLASSSIKKWAPIGGRCNLYLESSNPDFPNVHGWPCTISLLFERSTG